MELKFLNTCACVDSMDKITSRVYIRLMHEYGICLLKREMVPTMGSICLKAIISNLNSLRDNDKGDIAAYVNLFDIVTLGLVELNFEDTEKATNILPDFRIGKVGCEIMGMDYNKYSSHQRDLNHYKGRVVDYDDSLKNSTWKNLLSSINNAMKGRMYFKNDDIRLTSIFFRVFLEEVFYELRRHKGEKDYSYKLYDILYFNTTDDPELWGTDVMPEYKLMVKDDSYLEDTVNQLLDDEHGPIEDDVNRGLHWN